MFKNIKKKMMRKCSQKMPLKIFQISSPFDDLKEVFWWYLKICQLDNNKRLEMRKFLHWKIKKNKNETREVQKMYLMKF